MRLTKFDFSLPKELIATRPKVPRSSSRLLYYNQNILRDLSFFDLPEQLKAGDLLVFNNTKVIPALLYGVIEETDKPKEKWNRLEFLLTKRLAVDHWLCLCKPIKKLKLHKHIIFSNDLTGKAVERCKDGVVVKFKYFGDFFLLLAKTGQMPLPPYIRKFRPADSQDKDDYQTIFSTTIGSIASPTASLHFDSNMMQKIEAKGIKTCFVTLHVGIGTFLPIRTEHISDHKMHEEFGEIDLATTEIINDALTSGRRVIPVGTTSLRILESSASKSGQIANYKGFTDIYITPGFNFRVTSALITNFHLPKSSLFILISSFIGLEAAKQLYTHAIKNKYRFYSYGDASLLIP